MKTFPLAEVRNRISALVDEVARTHEAVTITRHGVPIAVMLSADGYESIMETLGLVNNSQDQERLTEAEESVAFGDIVTGEEMGELLRDRIRQGPASKRVLRTAPGSTRPTRDNR